MVMRNTRSLASSPTNHKRRRTLHSRMSVRVAMGTLLALLCATEARAAAVCSNTPGANDWIRCTQTGSGDIDIDLTNPAISTTAPADEGIEATHTGTGNIEIDVTGGSIAAADANGVDARHEAAGAIDIDLTNVDVSTQGQLDYGVYAGHQGTSGTGVDIDVTGGSVTTAGSSAYGIAATANDATGTAVGAAVSIDTKNTVVSTVGTRAYGVFGWINTVGSTAPVSVNVAGGSVTTAGENAHAVRAYTFSQTSTGAITVGVTDGAAVSTTGRNAHGVLITQNGLAGIDADLTDAVISTANTSSYGFMGWLSNTSGSQLLDIDILRGSVKTTGARSYGILGYVDRAASASALDIDADGVIVSTTGYRSYGFFALHLGTGRVDVDLEDVAISTTGDESYGVVGNIRNAASTAAIAIDAAGDRAITVEGLNTAGILGLHAGLGSVGVTTGAGTEIEAPFAVGMEARATNDAGAAGRIVVEHGGAAEARYAGVVALAARSSGHTFGDGAQTADDAARTEPMIAVTSSGTVTVGASVMDAFIRDKIAGADETLSAAEQAVLNAVTAEDSRALETALAALPAAYDADWKAEARNLLRKRIAEPDAARAANRVAEEILGLSRAGVRAVALDHTGMATFIRQGDRDPAILAIAAASRTEQQQAALAEQEKLSAAERTVLEAALTGSGLETALAALTGGAYTDDWKDGVRERAASYNAGGIRVDVTGGAVTAEGNGVEALYAVPHDRNGAISVTVAEGASVTGGANGLYVRGAGAGEGDLRAQSVTVNGQVRGGTGAGVHMAGGGRLTVGRTGRVGATSGVGVLSDGAGNLHATVAGTVTGGILALGDGDLTARVMGTVDGDIRTMGAGALTLALPEGGVVTGTVHDPVGPLTVAGSIGRLLYANGGTAMVAPTGRITGVDGEAIRSEAGDLAVTVAGTVTGDIRALGDGDLSARVTGTVDGDVEGLGGGDHTVTVPVSGTVTGTVRLDGSTVTVHGTVGRITLNDGGTVMVASTGQVTGVSAGSHGVSVGPGGTIENSGTIKGTTGIRAGAGSTIENHGTIEGTIGIEAGAGSTVVNSGTVRSTEGPPGIAINFLEAGGNTLTRRPGDMIIGKIQGLGSADTVDLSDLAVDEVGLLTFVDENERPVPIDILDIRPPRPGGVGRFIQAGNTLVGLDTTALALTDDVLSDLTGSIHAAVLGTGMLAHAQDGVPAQGRVWATPFGGWREQTGNGGLADGTHTFGGGLVGAGWGTPALSVGGFIGGSAGQLAVAGSRQNVDMQTVVGGVYAEQALRKDMRLDARVLVGHVAHDATRRVNPGTAHAAYTAFLFSPEIGVALRVPVTTTLHAVPRLRVRYAGLFTEGFRERAPIGNWDVGFAARAMQILEGRGEVSVPIALEAGGYVAPRLGVEGRWLMAGEMVEGTLPGGGTFQVSAGGDPAVATGTLGLGLSLPVATGTTLVGNFDGALTTEHAWRATGYIGITYSF